MMLIDSHTHLYLPEFDEDREEMLQRAKDKGVQKFFLPAIDSSHHESMFRLEEMHPDSCFAMMGLHPCSVKENYRDELRLIEKYLEQRSFCAIGEIGLDYYWDLSHVEEQKKAFDIQMEKAKELNIPISIHSREATQDAIDRVQKQQDGRLNGIFHCFGNGLEEARQIIELGFYLGIGGVLTYKKSGLAEVLKQIDLQYIVLETDAPYLSPVPFRGKRNESANIRVIAEFLAEVKGCSVEEVAEKTTQNCKKLFKFD